jgi:hypothetical protein
MAKARKRTTIADSEPLQSPDDDWMPFTDAFLHIQQVVGGEELAEEDLRRRLVSGDVEGQDRLVTPGKGINIIPLAPEDFENGLLFPRVPELDTDIDFLLHEAHRRFNLRRRVERLRLDGHNFFLRRADLYRVWPIRPADPASSPDEQRSKQLPTARPKGLGPKAWLAANTAWGLWSEGYRWTHREILLRKVRGRINDDRLSQRTLDEALAFLRRKGLIDR